MYTVYDIKSTMAKRTYTSAKAAKSLVTRLNKTAGAEQYGYASNADYNTHVVHMVERVNCMNGKTFMEPSNTPYYCSPSSESYWSN